MRNSVKIWKFPELEPVPVDYQLAIGGSALVASTLYQRGLTSKSAALAFLNPDLYTPSPPADLPGLSTAADRLQLAIQDQELVLVWGDFDVDGQTSTTLLVSALNSLGGKVTHHIPIRASESHGISIAILSRLITEIEPKVLLTCDTGIDARDAVDAANKAGLDVIITDHHQLPPALPEALAIVNPNMLPADHPLHHLPGVGVAYKLIEELFSRFKKDPRHLLDLVALGIVSDVAYQAGDTRYLLQRGLDVLKEGRRAGLSQIYQRVGLQSSQINEESIGFVIGPRLNALGRLADANSCVDFFTTSDPDLATLLAQRLDDLNIRRQQLTEKIYQEAQAQIETHPDLDADYPILVIQGPSDWNPGVIGIVASRLVERYQKPAIMLTRDGDLAKGSARSISGVPISALIASCGNLLHSHGGHLMAAGMSLPAENVPQFRGCLKTNYRLLVGDEAPDQVTKIDAEIFFQEISEDFIRDIQRMAPFGAGNPKLTFATRGVSTSQKQIRTIGKTNKHRKVTFEDSAGTTFDFLWWNSADIVIPPMPVDIAYSLELSSYRGHPQIQATIQAIRHSPDTPAYLTGEGQYKIYDFRNSTNPLDDIRGHSSSSGTVIWAEREIPLDLPSVPRTELAPHSTLIIWTAPSSRLVLKQAVDSVSPREIFIIGDAPRPETREEFIQSLLGLLKNMIRQNKKFDISRFAQRLAYPDDLIAIGLEWLHLQGDFDLSQIQMGVLSPGPGESLPGFLAVDERLKRMLQEIIAFRAHFSSANIGSIL